MDDTIAKLTKDGKLDQSKEVLALRDWWNSAQAFSAEDKPKIEEADVYGGRMALKATAAIPATMAVCYLLLVLYFRATGGYKQEHLHTLTGDAAPNEY